MEQTILLARKFLQSLSRKLSAILRWWAVTVRTQINRGLPAGTVLIISVAWPLWLIPIAILNQILAPHPVWIVLFVTVLGIYGLSLVWLRLQNDLVSLIRTQAGDVVVAGDSLDEHFELVNASVLPILWAEFIDESDIADYRIDRVVACGGNSAYRWQTNIVIVSRGIYHLGPSLVRWDDPFGLMRVEKRFPHSTQIVVYPRVAELQEIELPFGNVGGERQQNHPLIGSIRSASVRNYLPGDTLRHVHWPSTARHRALMVTELDAEHGGEVWIVLDLYREVQQGEGDEGTLEYAIVVAAGLAAQLLSRSDRMAVGLILAAPGSRRNAADEEGILVISPQSGQAQFWEIMGALAMAKESMFPLSQVLRGSRSVIGQKQSIVVITPEYVQRAGQSDDAGDSHSQDDFAGLTMNVSGTVEWFGELLRIGGRRRGSVILILFDEEKVVDTTVAPGIDANSPADGITQASALQWQLQQNDISCRIMNTATRLPSILTQRRTKTEVRTTPLGGAVMVEVEEEIG